MNFAYVLPKFLTQRSSRLPIKLMMTRGTLLDTASFDNMRGERLNTHIPIRCRIREVGDHAEFLTEGESE
jgi:hypothetical protein